MVSNTHHKPHTQCQTIIVYQNIRPELRWYSYYSSIYKKLCDTKCIFCLDTKTSFCTEHVTLFKLILVVAADVFLEYCDDDNDDDDDDGGGGGEDEEDEEDDDDDANVGRTLALLTCLTLSP